MSKAKTLHMKISDKVSGIKKYRGYYKRKMGFNGIRCKEKFIDL